MDLVGVLDGVGSGLASHVGHHKVRGLVAKEVAECKSFGVDLCYQVFYILFVWYQVNNWALKH